MNYSPRQWKNIGTTRRLLGHNIFTLDSGAPPDAPRAGEPPTLLLLHGYPTSSWDWEAIWPELCTRFRVVALDFLGFGFSEKPYPYDYQIREQADLVEALVADLGLTRFHVLAHDYGDTVAQELLARQNELATPQWLTLCLLNGGLFPETHRPRLTQRLLASPLGPFIAKRMTPQRLHNTLAAIFGPDSQPTSDLVAGYWELINYNNGRLALHKLIDYMAQRRAHRERWVQALAQSPIPIGLINGARDPISGAHMVARYKEVVGHPLMIMSLEDIGHYPQWEAPDQVLAAYLQFVQAVMAPEVPGNYVCNLDTAPSPGQ